jgi:uncharacterized protein YndB with AHSA1/START domain
VADPTGWLRETDVGMELVLDREFVAEPEELWEWVTSSERLGRWIGTWEGEGRVGSVIALTMTAEDSAEPEQVTVLVCDAPRRLQVEMVSEAGAWQLQLDIRQRGEECTLELSQLVEQGLDIASIGPGWEYYLDRLVAVRGGLPLPEFSDYHPGMAGYYADLG